MREEIRRLTAQLSERERELETERDQMMILERNSEIMNASASSQVIY